MKTIIIKANLSSTIWKKVSLAGLPKKNRKNQDLKVFRIFLISGPKKKKKGKGTSKNPKSKKTKSKIKIEKAKRKLIDEELKKFRKNHAERTKSQGSDSATVEVGKGLRIYGHSFDLDEFFDDDDDFCYDDQKVDNTPR